MSDQAGQEKGFFAISLIDQGLWDSALWAGVFYARLPQPPLPILGLMFDNGDAGKKIFAGRQKTFGKIDAADELYVSIVEGSVPGKERGYRVVIGCDPLKSVQRAGGKMVNGTNLFTVMTRVHTNPNPDSPHLRNFKQAYSRDREYLLLPATVTDKKTNKIDPHFEMAIRKKVIHFRSVQDLKQSDMEQVIFAI